MNHFSRCTWLLRDSSRSRYSCRTDALMPCTESIQLIQWVTGIDTSSGVQWPNDLRHVLLIAHLCCCSPRKQVGQKAGAWSNACSIHWCKIISHSLKRPTIAHRRVNDSMLFGQVVEASTHSMKRWVRCTDVSRRSY